MQRVDLNADVGENFGVWRLGDEAALFPWVTSVSIACGFHAGDPGTMASIVAESAQSGLGIGAHPGLPDLLGFGRRAMAVSPEEVRDLVTYQIGALAAFAGRTGERLQHIKPHGALYTMAEESSQIAAAIAAAVAEFDLRLILIGLSGGGLVAAGKARGLRVAHEVFADRAYLPDGTLAPRSQPGATLHDPEAVAARIWRLARQGTMIATDGTELTLTADTICLHGDSPSAALLAALARRTLEDAGVDVRRLDAP